MNEALADRRWYCGQRSLLWGRTSSAGPSTREPSSKRGTKSGTTPIPIACSCSRAQPSFDQRCCEPILSSGPQAIRASSVPSTVREETRRSAVGPVAAWKHRRCFGTSSRSLFARLQEIRFGSGSTYWDRARAPRQITTGWRLRGPRPLRRTRPAVLRCRDPR